MSVCILGSINQDVIAQVDALPRPGETVSAQAVLFLPGGKGANQAIAAARMGAAVRMIGCVGDDAAGASLTAYLADAGVATSGVRRLAGIPTGTAYIATDAHGENQIIVAPGANAHLTSEDIDLSGTTVLLAQLETPISATAAAFQAAGAAGVFRILNTAPALAGGAALFGQADMIILNQTELASYLALPEEPRLPEDALVARRLLTREGQSAVVTLGAAGAMLVTADSHCFAPALRVPVIDTTGAGDCFCGALAALIAEGVMPQDALAVANAAAALCVQAEGAGPAMPMRAAVDALLERTAKVQ